MPTTSKPLRGQQKREVTPETWAGFARQYLSEKSSLDAITKRVNDMKAAVIAYLRDHGDTDEKGSLYVDVEGVDGVGSLKYERRVGRTFDSAKATAWLKKHGMYDHYTKTVVMLDEDSLAAAAYEGDIISERIYNGWFVESETWALKTVK